MYQCLGFVLKDFNHPEFARRPFTESFWYELQPWATMRLFSVQCHKCSVLHMAPTSPSSLQPPVSWAPSAFELGSQTPPPPTPPSSHSLGIWQMRALMLMLIHSCPMQARSLSLFNSNSQNARESEKPALWWKPSFALFLPFFGNGSFSFVPPFRFEV